VAAVLVTSRVRDWTTPPDLLVGRVAGAGLLAWMGWIRLHLWNEGYRHLPSIGNLFLLNFIASVLLAVGVLVTPRRYLTVAAGAGALMAAGTLVSLAISINVGLLGFTDSYNAPFAHLSVGVEAAAAGVLAFTAVRSAPFLRLGSRAGA
jgi:hypothetical protein